jgi:hypothetical protein
MAMDSKDLFRYDRLKFQIASKLEAAADAHDTEDLAAIENGFDEI